MNFDVFCNLDSVKYWRGQLNCANLKNIKNESQLGGTRNAYTYGLLRFHNWLYNKTFKYTKTIHIDKDVFHRHSISAQLEGIEHLLALSIDSDSKIDFVRLIKSYLAEISSNAKSSVVKNAIYSIRSFFRENESEIIFHFRHKMNRINDKQQTSSLTIDDLHKILAVSSIQPIEKAVFVCKFQRGLDSSTLADRFNFDVWGQLTRHFQTEESELWDIENTPVPINLVRVKTGFMHVGFLDADAILAIQEYLDIRHSKPEVDKALFVNKSNKPITVNWISRRFHKLARRAGMHNTPSYETTQYGSHEMRDLLKSTLLDSGCRPDVADHVLGHEPRDSYEKQALLYPKSLAFEFAKASRRINIFSGYEKPAIATYNHTKYSRNVESFEDLDKIHDYLDIHEKRIIYLEKRIIVP